MLFSYASVSKQMERAKKWDIFLIKRWVKKVIKETASKGYNSVTFYFNNSRNEVRVQKLMNHFNTAYAPLLKPIVEKFLKDRGFTVIDDSDTYTSSLIVIWRAP